MKLGMNICHVSWHYWKGFQGHGVKGQGHVYKCVNAVMAEAYGLAIFK